MKRFTMGIALLTLAVAGAGCAKQNGAAKKPAVDEKPATTSTAEHQKTAAPTEHKTMKPVTTPIAAEHQGTTTNAEKGETPTAPEAVPAAAPAAKPAEAVKPEAKPEAGQPAAKSTDGSLAPAPTSEAAPKAKP